jgi:TonB family protein
MKTRNAVAAGSLLMIATMARAQSGATPEKVTRDDNAVITAAIESRFPDHSRPLLVVDKIVPVPFDAALEIRQRNPALRDLTGLDLARPVEIVTAARWTNLDSRSGDSLRPAGGALVLSLPGYHGDSALLEYQVAFPTINGTETGRVDVELTRAAKGWSILKETYVRLVPAPPRPEAPAVIGGIVGREAVVIAEPAWKTGDAPLRVGGDVKAPVVVKRVDAIRTDEAIAAQASGIVIIEVKLDEQGHVTGTQVLKPMPFGLDARAVDAVKQWVFQPGTLDGKPVAVLYNVIVNFRND